MPELKAWMKIKQKVFYGHPPVKQKCPTILLLPLEFNSQELAILLTPFDLKRLESYANNMLDYHVILDLLPIVAGLFFQRRLGDEVRLTAVQSSILLALGLQRKTIEDVEVCLLHPKCFFSVFNCSRKADRI